MPVTEFVIARRYAGPPAAGNGGWVCGSLAQFVETETTRPAVAVRLLAPAPLDRPLRVEAAHATARLLDGDTLLATAYAAPVLPWSSPPPVSYAEAVAAGENYLGTHDHPFPTCFVCSPERPEDYGPGLDLRTGALADDHGIPGLHAAAWTPTETGAALTWAALDCPGGWASGLAGRPLVLGSATSHVLCDAEVGVPHVVLAWPVAHEGRKYVSRTALWAVPEDAEPRLLARTQATWVWKDLPGTHADEERA